MRRARLARNGVEADEVVMTSGGRSAVLRGRIARGEYVVDERAVAEAMLSRVLVATQLFGNSAVRPRENGSGPGLDGPEPRHG